MKLIIFDILFLIVSSATSKQYHLEPILRQENVLANNGQFKFGFGSESQNVEQFRGADGIIRGSFSYLDDKGDIQHVEYTAGPNGYHVHNAAKLPLITPVTETPEVENARRIQEATYNRLKSSALSYNRVPEYSSYYSTTTQNPLVQSYIDSYPVKNRFNTLEVVTKRIDAERQQQPTRNSYYPIVNTPSPISYNTLRNFVKPVEVNAPAPVVTSYPQETPESHLAALREALAAQLVAYKHVPSGIPQTEQIHGQVSSGYRTELASPVKVQHSSPINFGAMTKHERELAIIAAARALMRILNNEN